jgi:trigger factor
MPISSSRSPTRVLPPIEEKDLSGIAVTRQVYDVPAEEIDEQAAASPTPRAPTSPRRARPPTGDKVTIDYLGKIDGEAFEGGAADDADLVIGSNQFIPGFEDQLVGVKEGDEKTITVTFPELSGRASRRQGRTFDIKVKAGPSRANWC